MEGLADYYRAADVLAQGSLEEGLGLSPLEALACETPVVATAWAGWPRTWDPYAALTPRRDAGGDGRRPAAGGRGSGAGARRRGAGREYVQRHWTREAAFRELRAVLADVVERRVCATRAGEEHA